MRVRAVVLWCWCCGAGAVVLVRMQRQWQRGTCGSVWQKVSTCDVSTSRKLLRWNAFAPCDGR
jgi:hypothetical protein